MIEKDKCPGFTIYDDNGTTSHLAVPQIRIAAKNPSYPSTLRWFRQDISDLPSENDNWTSESITGYHKNGMRKKIILTSVIVTLFLLGILCYKSWVAVFVITKYLSGRKEGKRGFVPSIIVPLSKHNLHLHHWLLSLIGGGILAVKGFYILPPEVFYGVISAITFQGIYCYGDWYKIVQRKALANIGEANFINCRESP